MSNDLFTTSMARYIHQEKRQEAYRNERERKRQAKDAERRKEKKQKKKHHKKKLTDARQVLDDDVTMSSPTDASQPSTSSTIAK
jgi:hypothetical protein